MNNTHENVFISLFVDNGGYTPASNYITKKIGLEGSAFLGWLCNENNKNKRMKKDSFNGWFPATINYVKHCCQVSKKIQNKYIAQLTELKLIETKNMGMPNQRHFRINFNELAQFVNSETIQNAPTNKTEKSIRAHYETHHATRNNDQNDITSQTNPSSDKMSPMGLTSKSPSSQIGPKGPTSESYSAQQVIPSSASINNNINNKYNNPLPLYPKQDITLSNNTTNSNNLTESNQKSETYKSKNSTRIPCLNEIVAYAETFGRNLKTDPKGFFKYYNDRQWKDKTGKSIIDWKQLFNKWNANELEKIEEEIQLQSESKQRVQKIKERLDEQQKKRDEKNAKRAAATTQLSCPECGITWPDPHIKPLSCTEFLCKVCGEPWNISKNSNVDNNLASKGES